MNTAYWNKLLMSDTSDTLIADGLGTIINIYKHTEKNKNKR